MKRFFLLFFLALSTVSFGDLKIREIPGIMERFFHYHIEEHRLNVGIVKRSMKLYVEQFDPEKAYLLESEALPYVNMSDAKAEEILGRLKAGDFRDFVTLNGVIQRAIVRAEAIRVELASEMTLGEVTSGMASSQMASSYAASERVIAERQGARMARFFLYHKSKSVIDSLERRGLVFALFEKKVRRGEYNYLFVNGEGEPLLGDRIEHLFSLRVLKAFAKSLDTHSSFFSPEEAYEMRLSLEKQFEGVGVVLSESIDGVTIAELVPGSPALQSGKIQINDLLVEIDGQSVEALSFEEVLDLLKKREGGSITLGFRRLQAAKEKSELVRVSLKKQPIVMQDDRIQTSFEKFGNGIIGKIALYSFYENGEKFSSEKDIKEAIRKFREQGELVGLVLDLRENPGGYLSQAVKVAGLFVSNGVIVISKYSKGEVHYLRNIVGKSFYNGPLVVLTSKMSASASEIVAQALQDYGVAVVVGDQRTFGKGSIQYQTVSDAKSELFFKVTVGRYYTVSGKSTQVDGVIADIVVPTQYAPYNIGERFLEYPLPPDKVESAFVDPLSDLDEKTRKLFQMRYLPYIQRKVSFWTKALPLLQKNSAYRIAHDPNFQAFLKRQEKIRVRQHSSQVNTIDEAVQIGMEDLQMMEGVNIVKDMIYIQAESAAPVLSPTGTDS